MSNSKNIALVTKDCIACGVCLKYCPLSALTIFKGLFAQVHSEKCVGCGKCAAACPTGVIQIIKRRQPENEKTLV